MFSELVDNIADITGFRSPAQKLEVANYANATLRETDTMRFFWRDNREEQILITATPVVWTIPRFFRRFRTVKYPGSIYPDLKNPGIAQEDRNGVYYYALDDSVVFSGAGATGGMINIAYYVHLPRLKYYEENNRPATYDYEKAALGQDPWTYLPVYDIDDQTRKNARTLVSNWLLEYWWDTINEGTRAKLYKTRGDTARSSATFATYKSMQNDMIDEENSVAAVEQRDTKAA